MPMPEVSVESVVELLIVVGDVEYGIAEQATRNRANVARRTDLIVGLNDVDCNIVEVQGGGG